MLDQEFVPDLGVLRQVFAGGADEGHVHAVAQGDVLVLAEDIDEGFDGLVLLEVAQGAGGGDAFVQGALAVGATLSGDSGGPFRVRTSKSTAAGWPDCPSAARVAHWSVLVDSGAVLLKKLAS